MSDERRNEQRLDVTLPVRWEGVLDQQEATIANLSTGGCFVLSGGQVELKELLRLEILFPGAEPIYLWAEVVDTADEIGFALRFTSIEDADRARLAGFIAAKLSEES
jgi:PilZ domain